MKIFTAHLTVLSPGTTWWRQRSKLNLTVMTVLFYTGYILPDMTQAELVVNSYNLLRV